MDIKTIEGGRLYREECQDIIMMIIMIIVIIIIVNKASVIRSVNQVINQSTNLSANQAINQLIDRSINHSFDGPMLQRENVSQEVHSLLAFVVVSCSFCLR